MRDVEAEELPVGRQEQERDAQKLEIVASGVGLELCGGMVRGVRTELKKRKVFKLKKNVRFSTMDVERTGSRVKTFLSATSKTNSKRAVNVLHNDEVSAWSAAASIF